MYKRFERNIGPISQQEQKLLAGKKIFIAGCGGIGGYLIEYMVRVGIGEITFADKDSFDETNLNRQILATEKTIGLPKAICAEERAKEIWSECNARGIVCEINKETLPELIKNADLVFDALDNGDSRKELAQACKTANIPLAHGAVSGWVAQAAVVMPGNNLYDLLYTKGQCQVDGVLPFAAAAAASLQVGAGLRFLCGGGAGDFIYVLDLFEFRLEMAQFPSTTFAREW